MSSYPPPPPPDWQNPPPGAMPPGGYPPPGNPYPPQNPVGHYPPPGYPPQDPMQAPPGSFPPPSGFGTGPLNPNVAYPPQPRGTGPLNMPPAYAPTYAPPPPGFGNDPNPFGNAPAQIGGSEKKPASGIEYLFDEHRIEYLAWGLVIFLMGFGIILLAIDTAVTRDLLLIAGPLVVGGILMFSSFLQRIVFGYSVSLITWAMAVGASAFGLTQAIAAVTDTRSGEYLQNQVLYFLGLLVIISGMVIIMQVFRSPND